MKEVHATKTVSGTDTHNPVQVLEHTSDKAVGHSIPSTSTEDSTLTYIPSEKVVALTKKIKKEYAEGLDYLKDK